MPRKNKCQMCMHYDYCPIQDARSCNGDRWVTYKYVPKVYIEEKEYLNKWEE